MYIATVFFLCIGFESQSLQQQGTMEAGMPLMVTSGADILLGWGQGGMEHLHICVK